MTEHTAQPSIENQPTGPRISAAPEALQLSRLDDFVGYGRHIAEQFSHEDDQSNYSAFRQRKIDELLAENGIRDNADDEDVHAKYVLARDIYEQVIDYNEDEWLTRADGEDVQRRNAVFRRVLGAYPNAVDSLDQTGLDDSAVDDDEEITSSDDGSEGSGTEQNNENNAQQEPLDPEKVASIDELEGQLNELRDKMAMMSAKRQDKFFGTGGKKFEQLKTEYNTLVQELGRRHLALHEGYSAEDKNLVATTVLFDEQEKLRIKTIEELEGKPLGKFIKWMNKGSVATRIAKGVGIGAVAGLGGSFLAGAAGAGVVAGGAVAASRFARNFAIRDNKARGMASIYSENGKSSAIDFDANALSADAASSITDENRMEKMTQLTGAHEAFEEDTKNEQDKRRKSALFGAAMMGAGALAGYGIHRGIEGLSNKDLKLTTFVHDKWNDFWYGDAKGPQEKPGASDGNKLRGPSGDLDKDGIPNAEDTDKDNDGVFNRQDAAPSNPDITVIDNGDSSDVVGDTGENMNDVTVEAGHGYTHELMDFAEANGQHLTPEQANQLHLALVDEFGADYIDIDGSGNDIYYEGQDVRLSEPGIGRWEKGVPEFSVRWMSNNGIWQQNAA